jgi:uncharacterized protein YoaH (UPF0181 family)
MSITIHPPLETELRAKAEAEGISVEAYLERLLRAERDALEELQSLAVEGLNSGDPIEVGAGYWEEKHRRLDERLNRSQGR